MMFTLDAILFYSYWASCIRDAILHRLCAKALCAIPNKGRHEASRHDLVRSTSGFISRRLRLWLFQVSFGGVIFRPGDWLYADGDGILVSGEELKVTK